MRFEQLNIGDKFIFPVSEWWSAPVKRRGIGVKTGSNSFRITRLKDVFLSPDEEKECKAYFYRTPWSVNPIAEVEVYRAKKTKKASKSKVKNRKRS